MNTTFRKLRTAGACTIGYRKLAKYLGGIRKYEPDTPISLITILESNGTGDACWSLSTVDGFDREKRVFACDCAESVLSIFESKYPDDKRPSQAISVAKRFVEGCSTVGELEHNITAAHAAAHIAVLAGHDPCAHVAYAAAATTYLVAAAAASASASAASVALVAEKQKQKELFIKWFGPKENK